MAEADDQAALSIAAGQDFTITSSQGLRVSPVAPWVLSITDNPPNYGVDFIWSPQFGNPEVILPGQRSSGTLIQKKELIFLPNTVCVALVCVIA